MLDFFYSDPHFGHANVVEYCARPFSSVEEMNETLIARYNNVVQHNDTVLWLGDCFFCRTEQAIEIMSRLNGRKLLVRGNHDRSAATMARLGFDTVADQLTLSVAGRKVLAAHYPYPGVQSPEDLQPARKQLVDRFPRPVRHKDQVLMHGHTHSRERYRHQMVHVGVDAWNFAPAPYAEIAALISANTSHAPAPTSGSSVPPPATAD